MQQNLFDHVQDEFAELEERLAKVEKDMCLEADFFKHAQLAEIRRCLHVSLHRLRFSWGDAIRSGMGAGND